MKQILLAIVCILLLIPEVKASDYITVDGIHYSKIDSDQKQLTVVNRKVGNVPEYLYQMISMHAPWESMNFDAEDYSGDVIIPERVSVDGHEYTVTQIAPCAFAKCTNLKSVVMPNSITYMGAGAFKKSSVETIKFSENLKVLNQNTNGCQFLKKLDLSNFEAVSFNIPPSLEQLILPNNGILYEVFMVDRPDNIPCKFIFKGETPPYRMMYVNIKGLPEKAVLYTSCIDAQICSNQLFANFNEVVYESNPEGESGLNETEIAKSKVSVSGSTITAPDDSKAIIYNSAGTVIADLQPGQSKTFAPGIYIANCSAVSSKILVK